MVFRYLRFLKKYLAAKQRARNIDGYPTNCHIVVTNRCNHKCLMCNYWKEKGPDQLTLKDFDKMLSSPVLSHLYSICITGGEPFLRKDLGEIIELIYNRTGLKPHINSNFSLPSTIDKILKKHKNHIGGIHTTICGPEKIHDKVTGVKGSYKRFLECIEVIKKNGFADKFRPGMTVNRENYKYMWDMYKKYEEFDISFTIVEHAEFAYGGTEGLDLNFTDDEKKEMIESLKKVIKKRGYWKTWKERIGDFYIIDWLENKGRPRPCYAGLLEIRIEGNGDIMACHRFPPMGNLKKEPLEKIWMSEKARNTRRVCHTCQKCMRGCSLSTLWVNPFKVRLKKIVPKF